MVTIVKRYHREELDEAIKELERRGYKQVSDVIPMNYSQKDFHYKERHGNKYLYKGTHTSSKGFLVKMVKEDN